MSNLFLFPGRGWIAGTTPSFGTQTLNATTNDFGIVFQMPEAATITTIGWRQGTLTGTPGTLRVGLQGVSTTTGLQNGTYIGGATNYVDYNSWAAGNNNTFITHTLPSSVSLTQGQLVCLYLKPQAVGTWNGTNQVTVTQNLNDIRNGICRPYSIVNGAISSSFQDEVFLVRSSTKTYGNPVQSINTASLTTATNPDEVGLAFTIGSTYFSTYQVAGVRIVNGINASNAAGNIVLYNNTTALQTLSVDTDQVYRFGANSYEMYFTDSTLATLNTGTEYILGQKATTTVASAWQPLYWTLPTSGDISAFSTETIRYGQRQGTGAWSFTNDTRLPAVELLIRSTAYSGGGGGLLVHPGTAGGMRG